MSKVKSPQKVYKAGDRIRWKDNTGKHYAGTILESCPFLSSLSGKQVFRTRIDTCYVDSKPFQTNGAVTIVELSEIEAAVTV